MSSSSAPAPAAASVVVSPARLAELRLCLAAERGDVAETRASLAAGVSVDCVNEVRGRAAAGARRNGRTCR